MLTGLPPFCDKDILSKPLHFPSPEIVPPSAQDVLTKLLNRKPHQRLGVTGAYEIKAHPFFSSIDWLKLLQRGYEPTFKPSLVCCIFFISQFTSDIFQTNAFDTKIFEDVVTDEAPMDCQPGNGPMLLSTRSQFLAQHFSGWSYKSKFPCLRFLWTRKLIYAIGPAAALGDAGDLINDPSFAGVQDSK